MNNPPDRSRRPTDPREAAEAAFKRATARPANPAPQKLAIPGVKELVSLRLDQDLVEHFQSGGPGWQDRINAALRLAAFGEER